MAEDHTSSDNNGRLPNGRFGKGHCGNPKGRPRKPKPVPGEELQAALDEVITMPDGEAITMRQFLAKVILRAAAHNPKLALDLLTHQPPRVGGTNEEQSNRIDDEIIAEWSRRQGRRS
ncbi:Uncharacterised protein [Starkeya nomas]|uniref:DUF5681 domain-containing protein n=1 Tax=Starkeya nomas TaxID=2666134 RepID=A0A5S9Q4W2_9HYPH|nr:DUF5681 domain-containing protein [Starkeya nomas]CAA0112381.1 Uncharacterised protein [Starkeya nomas]